MSQPVTNIPSLDELISDPGLAATLPPEAAQTLLIGLASIHPILLQRALMGAQSGQEDLLLTIPQVAKRLTISKYRAYELARQGALKSVRLGTSVRVRPLDLADYLAHQGA